MPEFLASTRYMDIDHPSVAGTVHRLVGGSVSERDAAVRLFRFVRDEIRYAFGPWGIPASETLEKRAGTCTNKNTLLVTMLRRAGIPAACGVLRVNAFEYFGSIAPRYLKDLGSPSTANSTHVYSGVHLEERWIKCDPSTDAELASRTAHFCRQTRLIEWDGIHDAVDFIEPEHIHADLGLRASIDDLLDKPQRNASTEVVAILNDYLRFIRSHRPFPSAEALIEAFWKSLDGHPPERLRSRMEAPR